MADLDARHPSEMLEAALRDAGQATTAELSRATGLGRDSVLKYAKALCAKGRAECRRCVRVDATGRKQRPVLWTFVEV